MMESEVLETLSNTVEQKFESGPEHLDNLAIKLAKFAVLCTTNVDSKLRDTTFALAGAVADWRAQLYPFEDFPGQEKS